MTQAPRSGGRVRAKTAIVGAWEPVIGLEIHAQLSTRTKIFCGVPAAFGDAPNTNIDPVTLGMPGVLPVMNRQAVKLAVKLGLALGSTIDRQSRFDRKHYFYPDLPKGYQITQFASPICVGGALTVDVEGKEKTFQLNRIHLEEDAGKSTHAGGRSLVDFNRAGTPLVEIVGEPDLRSAADAVAFMKEMHRIVVALGVSDGNMEQGNFRCDANISVRARGQEEFGTRTEIKNINSFKFVGQALVYEIQRHIGILEFGGAVAQETRGWDDAAGVTRSQRGKEQAHDYRYFPDPDLMVIQLTDAYVEEIRDALPELPRARMKRFQSDYALSDYDAEVLTQDSGRADYFESAARGCGDAKLAANWVLGDLMAALNADAQGRTIARSPVSAGALADMLTLLKAETISSKMAKQCFQAMFSEGISPKAWVEREGGQITDAGAIIAIVDEILDTNAGQVAQFLDGKTKVMGFFVGQVMKATKGKANPAEVNRILKTQLEARRP
ncbi:MAG: aspartyl-tRNA(Asn)/glutamyl-tRNA(Gln) amidotransferase subunit B [Myxococcota bacterium]|jgi:aspartyl-tRNA(Asn)/glutamyl-tRNA(Gln) amidotransferase subunit B